MKLLLLALALVCTVVHADYYETTQVCEVEQTIILAGHARAYTVKKTMSLRIVAVGSPQDYFVEAVLDGWTISSRKNSTPKRYIDRFMNPDRIWVYESTGSEPNTMTSWIDIDRISRVMKAITAVPGSRSEYIGVCRDAKPM
jgi:hypothetical protein